MRIFEYNKDLFVICEFDSRSRYGFNHTGKVFHKGRLVHSDKIHYINRTWESYEFESILRKCQDWIDNNLIIENFKKIA